MIILQNISYTHPNKNLLFSNINLTVNRHHKIGLTGNNGTGKSTLLKLIAGGLHPSEGRLTVNSKPYSVPQIFGQYNHLTVAQALQVDDKLKALKEIIAGNTTEENFYRLNDDWTIESRCCEALEYWQLTNIDLTQKIETLSGGEKTKVFLAGATICQPEIILLDEPSNHLDGAGRQLLHSFIQSSASAMIIVSHDRSLLNLLNIICELTKNGITVYGGNYNFYAEQKQIENNALNQSINNKAKALRKAKEKERETMERQQKLDARGKRKQEKAGIAKIMMNTLRNNAQKSTAKIKSVHTEKIEGIAQELQNLHSSLPGIDKIKLGFDNSVLHKGKILFKANNINFGYNNRLLWGKNLNFEITSGGRIALKGLNGSGKTTLINIILGTLKPQTGTVYHAAHSQSVYIDQNYSLINHQLNVYELAQQHNTAALQEHEIKIQLNRFLFAKTEWGKPCAALSGGERMRLMLCCLTLNRQPPDIIILDEPTNNLDIQNIEILTAAVNKYQGALIVVSHDEYFLNQIKIEREILLSA